MTRFLTTPNASTAREEDDRPPSRSQKKRDSLALQELAEALTLLSPAQQHKLPLSDDLHAALDDLRHLTSRESKRRQLQYLGRLMREQDDPEAIAQALEILRRS